MNYQWNRYDFKRFLLDTLHDAKQDELIFWKKSIPLPIDLVYKIFDESDSLIDLYSNHIISLTIISQFVHVSKLDTVKLSSLPNPDVETYWDLGLAYNTYAESKDTLKVQNLLKSWFKRDMHSTSEACFRECLAHNGRKYKRLMVPKKLKQELYIIIPSMNQILGVSNGDMFGNIVADYLGIYRSGFSDAFAAIFNKLLEFYEINKTVIPESYSHHNKIKISQAKEDANNTDTNITVDRVSDGSLWEPKYRNSKVTTVVNESHPYYRSLNVSDSKALNVMAEFMNLLSDLEYNSVSNSEQRVFEKVRVEISRALRVKVESQSTNHH